MHLKTIVTVAALLAAPSIVLAHGRRSERMVALKRMPAASTWRSYQRARLSQVFLRDHSDKAVTTDGFKGTAIFVIEGKPQRIPLTPAGENRLSGTSSVNLPANPKGAVQITTPSGSTMQAKF